MADTGKYFCPRLLDYLVIAGCRFPNGNNQMSQTPELLRRYPLEDHKDFPLPNDVIFFCQPEGCISVGPKRMSLRETTSFVFTLTEKDSGLVRYGICINFYRPFEKRAHSSEGWQKVDKSSTGSNHSVETLSSSECDRPRSKSRRKSRIRNNTLTSLCIVSHHPFFSTFRECLFILRRLIEACHDRSCVRRVGGSKATARDTVWGVLTGQTSDNISSLVMHEVREIETWILRLLSAPVPVPGKTRVEVHVLPRELQPPLLFALPDNTRFGLVDFPLHLPLELLGVDTCLKALTAIMLEHKVILQSRDYNALSMSVMAFVAMLYPLEYMFPVIPLLPTCMASAEQLLLAPTPYLIGVPASFFGYKKDFPLPDDIWLVDLDGNKITTPSGAEMLPPLPEPEGTALKTHLKQCITDKALASMSMTPQPIKNLDALAQNLDLWQRRDSLTSATGFNPLIYGNDVDSVDVATRVAMVRFFNSPNTLGNFTEHTRTLRLYPRPVVAFQLYSFLKSRADKTLFTSKLARTQAVEYLSEWSLCPTNLVYQRVQTAVYDPSLIGDKPKWYAQQLQPVEFHIYDNSSSLGAALTSVSEEQSDDNPTDESGSDSDGADSTSSSYSSLSDFVLDLYNSDIRGETPSFLPERQIFAVDESKVYSPPSKLHLPDAPATNSDSALSLQEDSDMSSSASSSPSYSHDVTDRHGGKEENVFRYDSGNTVDTRRPVISFPQDSINVNMSANPPSSPHSPHITRTMSQSSQSPKTPPPRPAVPPSPGARLTPPVVKKPLQLATAGLRPLGVNVPGTKNFAINKPKTEKSATSSIISTISKELTDIAHSATSTASELFGTNKPMTQTPVQTKAAAPKPFTPLGNRKALVEKSGLVKHATNRKQKEPQKLSPADAKANSNSDNQQFLKEVINSVLEGKGVSWMKVNRINKLMEDENYRNFVVSRLNRNLDQKVSEDAFHIEDVCVSRNVFKGILTLIKSVIHGLGHTINNHGLGGMASAYMVLEIAHTHYWARDPSNKSDPSMTPEKTSLHGSHESLDSPSGKLSDDISTSKWWQSKRGSIPQARNSPAPTSHSKPHPTATTAATHSTISVAPSTLNPSDTLTSSSPSTESGSPVIVNGDEFENIEITSVSDDGGGSSGERPDNSVNPHKSKSAKSKDRNSSHQVLDSGGGVGESSGFMTSADWNKNAPTKMSALSQQQLQRHQQQASGPSVPPVSCDIVVTDVDPDSRLHQGQGDMLREMVKNKELIKTGKLDRKFNSLDSEMSEASTLVSTSSEKEDFEKRRHRINHQSIRSALSDSEMETNWPGSLHARHSRSSSVWSNKSAYSSGYRFHEGKLVHVGTAGLTAENGHCQTYLFEELVGKDRSRVWDHMQFWEDMFLDAVAQERDIIGMDQRPSEMMERYNSLGEAEKKRLEYDEDRLLAVMLFNQAAFMLMMRVPKNEIKKKIRRLLGKSHIGLVQSQDINNLLDNIQHLYGNDIDLKPMCSRRMQKQSFTVHWGNDNTGDMLFMEVCDDCLLLRSVTGAIHDRWWFEKLVNMTYCPKTKVLCLWRKNQDKVQLNQFYTKKCKELYFSVKESMEKAASRNTGRLPGPELGGEFPVQDLKTKEGGLLQVCMEGIGLLLQNSKLFIELARIRKCFTQKGGIFVLEEFDVKTKQIIQHRFKSSMANDIVFMFHRMLSIQLANAMDNNKS
ncbi:MAP kinase-activating death domain protein-like isoform X6 [Biomphalaria glabrata]|uniref:MAP kinase-activating death domain protein n=1 Tax=Biomphalaria glabrata TaxID=6526 RepID=A0A9W3BMY4_BIOGL|nr:MAP kinase-activating death domain protein-like isoform X6 [Biomphalaria glabrata]